MKIFYCNGIRMLTVVCLLILSTGAFSQIVVTTNADAGAGSLRDAIDQANLTTDAVITFDLPSGSTTITLSTPLPAITGANTVIQGYSQPGSVVGPIGASRTIVVQLDCNDVVGNGLDIQVDGVIVSGIAIYNAGLNGISFAAGLGAGKVWGCYIGTDATGIATGLGNTLNGVLVGDNLTASSSIIIGSEGDGAPPPTAFDGTDADEGNVIVGNGLNTPDQPRFNGVMMLNTTGARVSGNYIGIGADGTTKIGNGLAGVQLTDGSAQNIIGVDDATSTAPSQKNYVGNNAAGVLLFGNSNGNFVAGNFLGVNPDTTAAPNLDLDVSSNPTLPIFGSGVMIWGSSFNIIGTNANGIADQEESNLIGNNTLGVFILALNFTAPYPPNTFDATDNRVMGNMIGTNPDFSRNLGNTWFGVAISGVNGQSAINNIIGADDLDPTLAASEGNVIFNSGFSGVSADVNGLPAGVADFNRVSHNTFDNNSRLITGGSGMSTANTFFVQLTPNDCGDGDTGGNDKFNRPVIESVLSDANSITLKGWAPAGSTLEFYTTSGSTPLPGGTQNFGELRSHLMTLVEGDDGSLAGFPDLDGTTSAYPDDGTGVSCTENRFSFSFPISALQGAYTPGSNIAAIAFDAMSGPANTSEPSFIVLSMLPVKLTEFTGKLVEGKSQLKWVTASENNSHYFEIERSADGAHYGSIGQLAAKGYSTVTSKYAYTDGAPIKGLNYYRLKQVDKDGKYVYSNVVVIRNNGAFTKTQIIPNPVHNMATISIMLAQKEELQVRLIDGTGKLARSYRFTGNSGENQFFINDLGNLPAGIYTIDIRGQQTSIQERLMKY